MFDTKQSINELFTALYRFSSNTFDEQYKVQKRYTREVQIYQLHFPKPWITYRLYCKRFVFDDPYSTALLRKVAYVFDVITLRVDLDNYLLKVDNVEEIQMKWLKTKADLERNHQGYEFDRFMASIDGVFNQPEKMLDFVSSNRMYGLFLKSLSLAHHINETDYQQVERISNRLILSNRSEEDRLVEQYVMQDKKIIECFQDKGNTQYELLWIG